MPDLINKEMPIVQVKGMRFYSEDTIHREFDVVGQYQEEETAWVLLKKDKSFAVIGILGKREDDNKIGISLLGQVEFKEKPDFSFTKVVPTKEYVLQVDSVQIYSEKFRGFGFKLYLALVEYGYIIVSDHTQYIGGKKLWEKIARLSTAKNYSVYIINNGEPVLDSNGSPLEYNGMNLDDDKIWAEPTNNIPDSRRYVLLMMKKNTK